jgi:hypothetical protein
VDRFNEVRAETPPDSRVVSLANGPDGTRVSTVHAVRRDGIIIEFFVNVRQEGTVWKIERWPTDELVNRPLALEPR